MVFYENYPHDAVLFIAKVTAYSRIFFRIYRIFTAYYGKSAAYFPHILIFWTHAVPHFFEKIPHLNSGLAPPTINHSQYVFSSFPPIQPFSLYRSNYFSPFHSLPSPFPWSWNIRNITMLRTLYIIWIMILRLLIRN